MLKQSLANSFHQHNHVFFKTKSNDDFYLYFTVRKTKKEKKERRRKKRRQKGTESQRDETIFSGHTDSRPEMRDLNINVWLWSPFLFTIITYYY